MQSEELRVGITACKTKWDEWFSIVRRTFNVPNDFLSENFDFSKLASAGGKGGDKLARSADFSFFVKQLSAGDAKKLSNVDFLKDYVSRVSNGSSLICRFMAVIVHPNLGDFLVMANCLPADLNIEWSRIYDLKGSADDKTLVEDGER